jgi:hypothetical protein
MGGHIAGSIFPFGRWIRENHTKFSGGVFNDFLTAITLINNRVTTASIKFASFLGHKDALSAFS